MRWSCTGCWHWDGSLSHLLNWWLFNDIIIQIVIVGTYGGLQVYLDGQMMKLPNGVGLAAPRIVLCYHA